VLRNAALGDLMFALPALSALRGAYPDAEIVLLGDPWHEDFLLSRPGPVDRVIRVPGGLDAVHRGDFGMQEEFFDHMRNERFDVAIQLFGGGRHSNLFVKRLGAGLTVGAKSPEAAALDRWIPYIYYQSETFRCLEICSLLGMEWAHPEGRLAVTDSDLQEAEGKVAVSGPLAAIHPGAGSPQRRWAPKRFSAVADGLVRAGATVVVTGTSGERNLTREVLGGMQERAIELTGQLSLGGLAGLLSRCAVVVSNDSGPLYLAAAVGASTVGIYWCGNLLNGVPPSRTRHRPAISWRLHCPVCHLNCMEGDCEHEASFVDKVTVKEVLGHALDLLNQS
jgi:ADP-heptose:LPS heptosyltransferase